MKKSITHAEAVFWTVYLSLLCAFIMLLIGAIVQRNHVSIIPSDAVSLGNPDTLFYHIESVTEEKGKLQVKGWAAQKGVLYPYFNYGIDESGIGTYANMQLACMSHDSNKLLLFPTQLLDLPDAGSMVADGYNYPYSSFIASVPVKYLNKAREDNLAFCFYDPEGNRTVYFTETNISYEQR